MLGEGKGGEGREEGGAGRIQGREGFLTTLGRVWEGKVCVVSEEEPLYIFKY